MHCPRCGQQQVTEDTKFCSRCGFSLNIIAEVVANGGSLPQLDMLAQQMGKKKWLTRKNGMAFSLFWLIFFLLIMAPFWGILDVERLSAMSAVLGIFGGFLLFLFSVIFLESPPKGPYYYPHPPMP